MTNACSTIPVDSVYTGHPDRDNELKGHDFFSADEYPEIRFESTSVLKTGERTFEIAGELPIRGVTRPIDLTDTRPTTALDQVV